MEIIFLTAPPSLLWPDGIRERSEAVKTNTSKKKGGQEEEEEEKEEEEKQTERNKQEEESLILAFETEKNKLPSLVLHLPSSVYRMAQLMHRGTNYGILFSFFKITVTETLFAYI